MAAVSKLEPRGPGGQRGPAGGQRGPREHAGEAAGPREGSPSVARRENPARLIPLAAQVTAPLGLGEWGDTPVSSGALQILLVKATEKLLRSCSEQSVPPA